MINFAAHFRKSKSIDHMITLNNPGNIDLSKLRITGEGAEADFSNRKPFVSCFRVVKGREQFEQRDHRVSKLPQELHGLFHN